MKEGKVVLVTGATGKVGQNFIRRFVADPAWQDAKIRAFCHNRLLEEGERLEVVRGSMAERGDVARAVAGTTHVVHLATCKETPADIMDVAIKGMFWLLEECRESPSFEQLIRIGGDAGMGNFIYPHPVPETEAQKHSADTGCLRAPWIMEKDDFKFALSFGEDVFGGPRWRDLVGAERADAYVASGAVPVMLDPAGEPVLRNFVHVEDLAEAVMAALDCPGARQQLFNICMDEPVDYREMAKYLYATRGLPGVDIKTESHRTWLDNSKAKFLLGWRPQYDLEKLIDAAWEYERAEDDPRKIWYPG